MDQQVIFKLTIPPEEILATRLLICHVNGCTEQFSNASHLQMHLTRHHRILPGTEVDASAAGKLIPFPKNGQVKHFHCPVESCVYHLSASGNKFFTSFRYLKQHFLKIHSTKNFICNNCNGQKSFATVSLLRAHQTNCGQSFVCKVCEYGYGSREALLTHAKRKNHDYQQLLVNKVSKRKTKSKPVKETMKNPKNDLSKSIQVQPERQKDNNCSMVKISQTTQTDRTPSNLSDKIECSTQTASSSQILPESLSASTMDSYCQTNLEQFNYFEDNSLSCFGNATLPTAIPSSESVICVCTETQTDQIYDEMFPNEDRTDPMLYSHMYTQTCEDIFSDLALATIETQTNWADDDGGLGEFLVTAETQTNSNRCGSEEVGPEDRISSIQTQTTASSMEFLNAISSENNSTHTQTS